MGRSTRVLPGPNGLAAARVTGTPPAGPQLVPFASQGRRQCLTARAFLAAHHISLVVHGDDIPDDAIEQVYGDIAAAGRLRLVRRDTGISTTEIIRRVQFGDA